MYDLRDERYVPPGERTAWVKRVADEMPDGVEKRAVQTMLRTIEELTQTANDHGDAGPTRAAVTNHARCRSPFHKTRAALSPTLVVDEMLRKGVLQLYEDRGRQYLGLGCGIPREAAVSGAVASEAGAVAPWRRGPPETRPWGTMEVGSCFSIPPGPDQPKIASIRVACSVKGSQHGRKFRCHRHPDGTIEVWRQR
jgi:hypothetical protein